MTRAHDAALSPVEPHGEEGIALFYALLVAIVVAGIVTVVAVTSMGEVRQSAFELDFEDTLHVAEGGLEVALQELDGSSQYTTIGADGTPVLGPGSSEDTFEWAVNAATATSSTSPSGYNLPAIGFGEGEAVAIRPEGRDANYVYGVGFTPSRDAYPENAYVRVVRSRVGFTDTEVDGEFAILAGQELAGGSGAYGVGGLNGSIHTNGTLSLKQDYVSGTISFSDPAGCTGDVCPPDDEHVIGPVPPASVPSSTIDDIWKRPAARQVAEEGTWYDYCDGTGRHTGNQGKGWYIRDADNDDAPCTGQWLTGSVEPDGWNGLDLKDVNDTGAVYWIDSTSEVTVTKASWRLSVMALGNIRFSTSANAPGMRARYPGLLMYSEGDVDVGGNATSVDPDGSIIYAGGDLTLRGTTSSVGISYVAQGTATVSGTAQVSYDGNARADIGGDGDPLFLGWEEVH